MKRPAGIVLSAVALGLIALFGLLLALVSMAASLNGARFAQGAGGNGVPSPAMYSAVMFFMTLLYLAAAAWSTFTLVGLMRMRSWARISALVLAVGGCGLAVISALGLFAAASMLRTGGFPVPPNVPAELLHKVLVFMGALSLGVAAASVGWIAYLVHPRTRQTFEEAKARRGYPVPPYPPDGVPLGTYAARPQEPLQQRWLSPRRPSQGPLTDFTIARPLGQEIAPTEALRPVIAQQPPPEALPVKQDFSVHAGSQPRHPQTTAARSGRPVSVTILSVLALFYAFVNLVGIVSPLPGFLFGHVVSGWPLHLYNLVSSAALAICGLGMLRLQRPAWVLSFIMLGINALNFLSALFPGARARYLTFLLSQPTISGSQQAALSPGVMTVSITFAMFTGFLITVFFAIVLWRAQWAFEPAPAAPQDRDAEI